MSKSIFLIHKIKKQIDPSLIKSVTCSNSTNINSDQNGESPVLNVSSQEVKPYSCNFINCSLSFCSSKNLRMHQQTHKENGVFKCSQCTAAYTQYERYEIHLRNHKNVKPYICNYEGCNKVFNEKGNLKTHQRIHTNEKPYECSNQGCGMKFKTQGQLKDHIKGHYDLKPYICHICLAKFTRNSSLKIHLNTHTDIKPYKCPVDECNKSFYDKTQIRFHMKKHYADEEIEERFREYLINKADEISHLVDLRKNELKAKSMNRKPIKPNYPKYIRIGNTYEVQGVNKPEVTYLGKKRENSNSKEEINVPIE